jgi:hypothetical protein
MITQGSKIRLLHPMGAFKNVGEVCDVVNVTEDGVISFRFGNYNLGCMSYNEYQKYFEEYHDVLDYKKQVKWTCWKKTSVSFNDFLQKKSKHITLEYRHNGTKVQIRGEGVKARSSCYKTDTFDLLKGLELTTDRWIMKYLTKELKDIEKNM